MLDLKNEPDFKVYYEKFAARSEPWDMTFSDCVVLREMDDLA